MASSNVGNLAVILINYRLIKIEIKSPQWNRTILSLIIDNRINHFDTSNSETGKNPF